MLPLSPFGTNKKKCNVANIKVSLQSFLQWLIIYTFIQTNDLFAHFHTNKTVMNLYIWIDTNCPRNKHSLKWKSTDSRWRETSDHAHTLINFVNLKTEKIWRCSAINTYKMFLLKIIFYTFYTQKVHVNGKKKNNAVAHHERKKTHLMRKISVTFCSVLF